MAETAERSFKPLASRAKEWLIEAAFPLWADKGVDPRGGFRERLDLDAEPIEDETTRVRVQARQTYAFARGHALGFCHGEDLARAGAAWLMRTALAGDQLPGRLLTAGGGRIGEDVELYDCAFVATALFEAAAALGDEAILKAAISHFRRIEDQLARQPGDGFIERLPEAPLVREQNPHMHLFEAGLSAYRATEDARYLTVASEIERFVFDRFATPDGGLVELSGADLPSSDNRIEAGHLFEWSWLLSEFGRLKGDEPPDRATLLRDAGARLTGEGGRVPMAHDLPGEIVDARVRTWGATEALRAHVIAARMRVEGADNDVFRYTELLFKDHLREDGAWMDVVDLEGRPLAEDVTAATLYHIVGAFDALLAMTE